GVSRRLRQIVKIDPHVASRRTGKIFPPDLLVFLRQLGPDTVWIERQRICPLDLCSFWIDLKTSFLADREPSLPLLICHDRSHLLSPFCSWFRLLPLMRTLAMPCADVTGAPFWRICRAAPSLRGRNGTNRGWPSRLSPTASLAPSAIERTT